MNKIIANQDGNGLFNTNNIKETQIYLMKIYYQLGTLQVKS